MQTLSSTKSLKGVFTALVTPFQSDGSVDWPAYDRLLDQQLKAGIHGVVPCGTTGESPVLAASEKEELIRRAVTKCKGKALVIAGTGSNDTSTTIRDTEKACSLGVDAVLVVTPYYNKPSQKGLEAHFHAIAEASTVPVILYNVPGRTSVSLSPAAVGRLSTHPRIFGIKEATGNLSLLLEMKAAVKRSTSRPFSFLSGDDPTFWPFLSCGGDGVISVASNVLPQAMKVLYDSWNENRIASGLELFETLAPFFNALFIEANPVPVKTILEWQKLIHRYTRLPLVEMESANFEKLKRIWNVLPSQIRGDLGE